MPRGDITSARSASASRVNLRPMGTALRYPGGGVANSTDLGAAVLFDSTQPWALSFWADLSLYFDSQTAAQGLFGFKTDQGVLFGMFLQNNSVAGLKIGAASIFANLIPTNVSAFVSQIRRGWHHFVLVFNGVDRTAASSFTFYVDGAAAAMSSSTAISATTHVNSIGCLGVSFSGRGFISRTRIWNGGSAMTAAQVASMYSNDIMPVGPTLIREFLTQEGSGSTLTDTSGNGGNGTISGTVAWVTTGPLKARTGAGDRPLAA